MTSVFAFARFFPQREAAVMMLLMCANHLNTVIHVSQSVGFSQCELEQFCQGNPRMTGSIASSICGDVEARFCLRLSRAKQTARAQVPRLAFSAADGKRFGRALFTLAHPWKLIDRGERTDTKQETNIQNDVAPTEKLKNVVSCVSLNLPSVGSILFAQCAMRIAPHLRTSNALVIYQRWPRCWYQSSSRALVIFNRTIS